MASAMDSRLAYARLSAGRYGKPPTHSYQRLQQLLHHVLGHDPCGKPEQSAASQRCNNSWPDTALSHVLVLVLLGHKMGIDV